MAGLVPMLTGLFVRVGLAALVTNEIRGLVVAGPVLYGMYQAGGTIMAIWLGFCSLAGILISIAAPVFVANRLLPRTAPVRSRARQQLKEMAPRA